MDVKDVLAQAWEAVEGSGVPTVLHEVAFANAIRLIAGAELPAAGASTPAPGAPRAKPPAGAPKRTGRGASEEPNGNGNGNLIPDEDEFFATFAEESGVDEAALRSVYYIKDGGLRLSLSRRVLGESIAEKNRTVAMLTLGALHYVRGDMAIKIGEIRDAIGLHGYDPSRNLSAHLDAIPGTQTVGAKNDKAVRVQAGRFEGPFKELIQKVTAN